MIQSAGVVLTLLCVFLFGAQEAIAATFRERAEESTVLIESQWEIRATFQGESIAEYVEGNGSGFLIAPQGIIVTNNHVIDPEGIEDEIVKSIGQAAQWVDIRVRRTALKVRAFSGSEDEIVRPGNVVRRDANNDLAIMSVNFGQDMPYLRVHAPVEVKTGERVMVYGFPANSVVRELVKDRGVGGTEVSISQGRITAVRRDRSRVARQLQLDAAVTGGNSGGPVLDIYGRVIGVLASTVGGGVNFAISADTLIDFAEQYIPEADRPKAQLTASDTTTDDHHTTTASMSKDEVILHLRNGSQERGILKHQTGEAIVLKIPGLGTISYALGEVESIEQVPR